MARTKRKNVRSDVPSRYSRRRKLDISEEGVEEHIHEEETNTQELANLAAQAEQCRSPTAAAFSPTAVAESPNVVASSPTAAASSPTTAASGPTAVAESPTAGASSSTAAASSSTAAGESPCSAEPSIMIFRYSDYSFETPLDRNPNIIGEVTSKSELGKPFNDFRIILKEQNLEKFFRSSSFGKYLEIGDKIHRFQMKLAYQLIKRWIKSEDITEFWINYCGMPICFGMKEFAMVSGFKCHIAKPSVKTSAKIDKRYKEIVDAMGKKHCKTKELLELLKSGEVKRRVKKSLCLVYFVHSVIMGKDQGTNARESWFKLAADRKAFCAYPWGRDSFTLTVDYLRKAANSNTSTHNLYGFPWAFAAWAFEAIPYLRKRLKDYDEEVSTPRILRWLAVENNELFQELFDPPEDAIVYPHLIPTESEREMDILKEFVPMRVIIEDPKIVKLVSDLAGVTVIKRFVPVVVDVGVDGAADDVGDVTADGDRAAAADGDRAAAAGDAAAAADGNRETVAGDAAAADGDRAAMAGDAAAADGDRSVAVAAGAAEAAVGGTAAADERGGFSSIGGRDFPSPFTIGGAAIGSPATVAASTHKQTTCTCGCQACAAIIHGLVSKMNSLEETITRVDTKVDSIGENVNTLISKRGIIPSSRVMSPYTPIVQQKRRRQKSKVMMSVKKKAAGRMVEQHVVHDAFGTKEQPPASVADAAMEQQLAGDVAAAVEQQPAGDVADALEQQPAGGVDATQEQQPEVEADDAKEEQLIDDATKMD